MARCYKDTILIMITQRFEMITKVYETSHMKPSKNYKCLPLKKPSSVLVLLLLKCGLGLEKKNKLLSLLHGTCHTKTELSWKWGMDNDMTYPKWATWEWRTNDAFNNWSILLSDDWSVILSGKDLDHKGEMWKSRAKAGIGSTSRKISVPHVSRKARQEELYGCNSTASNFLLPSVKELPLFCLPPMAAHGSPWLQETDCNPFFFHK